MAYSPPGASYDSSPRSFDRMRPARPNVSAFQHPGSHIASAAMKRWIDTVKWNSAAHAADTSAPAPVIPGPTGAPAASAAAGPAAALPAPAPALDPVAALNAQFAALAAQLHSNVATAHTGIGAVGDQLNSQLGKLGHDTHVESGHIASDLARQYAIQRSTEGADQNALLADLTRNGAQTGVLNATNKANNKNLSDEKLRQVALNAQLGQVLQATMRDRIAGGRETTAGSQQQLTQKEALFASQIEQQRMQAVQALQAQLAAAAASGGGGGGGGGRRGGGRGRGGSGSSVGADGMTPSQRNALSNKLAGMTSDVNKPIDFTSLARNAGLFGGTNQPGEVRTIQEANDILQRLAHGAAATTEMTRFMREHGFHGDLQAHDAQGRPIGLDFDPNPMHLFLQRAIYEQQHIPHATTAAEKQKAYLLNKAKFL